MIAQGLSVTARLLLATGGGYAVSAGFAALVAVGLPVAPTLPRSEAVALASMLAFLVYLAILLWAFTELQIGRLCIVLGVTGATSWAAALTLTRPSG